MAKLARLPANDRAPEPDAAEPRPIPHLQTRYYAFLSYSHKDKELADWLHRELERFRVPHALTGKLTENGVIPKRLTPIFRDQHELAAADDLGEEIRAALASSQFLIVLCSPDAAKSRWTNQEIEEFKRTRPQGCVLAAIASGEPFASEMPGREDEECFPPALMQKYDRRGRPTGKRAEPLAADLRGDDDQRRQGFLKLVAGMLGVGLDELVQRETTRRQRRLAWVAAASLGGMAVTSTLAIAAIESRNSAREQRREAEGLIGFMLGDLKDKLEPIGRLDALDGVGKRVLVYYQKQGTTDLSDAALTQRSRALSLMGEVANSRGDLDEASRLYREAMAGTGETIRRKPDDPQRLFDHAQNVFWVGDLAKQRGDLRQAEAALRQYKALADNMVRLQPDNLKWRMEVQYAEADLGIVLLLERRFTDARRQFAAALQTIEAVAAIDPKTTDYRKSVADSLAWLADAQFSEGRLQDAIESRKRQIDMLERMRNESGDVAYREKLIPARKGLGNLFAAIGNVPAALAQLKAADAEADHLLPTEPTNTRWMNYASSAKLTFADLLLSSGDRTAAAAQADSACGIVNRLIAIDPTAAEFQSLLRTCLLTRAKVAASSGDLARAIELADRGLAVARATHSSDASADTFEAIRAERLIGDFHRRVGDVSGSENAWRAAERLLPRNTPERPREMNERLKLLQRLGRSAEAQLVSNRLNAIGYRSLD
jgi:tetratricopeptide (TPR) repeat protein